MKKTIAALFNLLFIITIWGLSGNIIAWVGYAWIYLFQSIATGEGFPMTWIQVFGVCRLIFLGLT